MQSTLLQPVVNIPARPALYFAYGYKQVVIGNLYSQYFTYGHSRILYNLLVGGTVLW